MDGDDYTTDGYVTLTVDQRILAQLAALELRILKLEQRNEHADATAEQLG